MTLHRYTASGALAERLADFMAAVGTELIGLAATPSEFEFVSLRPGQLDCPPETYDLRAFCDAAEFRWRQTAPNGQGAAAILSEQALGLGGQWTDDLVEHIATMPRHYVLWGEHSADEHAWSVFDESRIGELRVPVTLGSRYARLNAIEYVACEPAHGNAYVTEERLIGISPYAGEPYSPPARTVLQGAR